MKKTTTRKRAVSKTAAPSTLEEKLKHLQIVQATYDKARRAVEEHVVSMYVGHDLTKQPQVTHVSGDHLCVFKVTLGTGNQVRLTLTHFAAR